MADLHPAAGHSLPSFITAPGETDTLLVLMGVLLIAAVMAVGVFFLWLHSLPERMVHNKWQYDFVAVLCLLALFTHIHAFWVAALLLAMVRIPAVAAPDFLTPLRSIARSLNKLAAEPGSSAPRARVKEVVASVVGEGAGASQKRDVARDA